MFTWVVGRMVCGVLECQRFTKYGGAPWISSNENNKKITRVHFRWLISLLLLRLLPSKQDRFSIDILLYGGRTVLYRCSAEFLLLLLSPFFHWRAPFPCFKLLCSSLATHICTALSLLGCGGRCCPCVAVPSIWAAKIKAIYTKLKGRKTKNNKTHSRVAYSRTNEKVESGRSAMFRILYIFQESKSETESESRRTGKWAGRVETLKGFEREESERASDNTLAA